MSELMPDIRPWTPMFTRWSRIVRDCEFDRCDRKLRTRVANMRRQISERVLTNRNGLRIRVPCKKITNHNIKSVIRNKPPPDKESTDRFCFVVSLSRKRKVLRKSSATTDRTYHPRLRFARLLNAARGHQRGQQTVSPCNAGIRVPRQDADRCGERDFAA